MPDDRNNPSHPRHAEMMLSYCATGVCRAAKPITGDTITDMQIRELLNATSGDGKILKACLAALGLTRGGSMARWRARCAEILEARRTEGK